MIQPPSEKCPECPEHPVMVEQSDEVGIWWTCPICFRAFDVDDLDSYDD